MDRQLQKESQSSFFEAEIEHILKEDDEMTMIAQDNNERLDSQGTLLETKPITRNKLTKDKGDNDAISSSTRVIESLHEKIDTLTNTNLKLTVQSHDLLNKLERFQKKEIKLTENMTSYNHEHENLNLMLQRKLRKIQATEEELDTVHKRFDLLNRENEQLKKDLGETSTTRNDMLQKIEIFKEKYNKMLDNQEEVRNIYIDEICDLKSQIDDFKYSVARNLTNATQNTKKSIDQSISQFTADSATISGMNKLDVSTILNNHIDSTIDRLETKSLLNLFKAGQKLANDYISQNKDSKMELPSDIKNSDMLGLLEKNLNVREKQSSNFMPLTRRPGDSPQPNRSPGDFSSVLSRTRVPSSTGNTPANKNRHSFYSASNGQLPGTSRVGSNSTLPGMRKTSNNKENHTLSPNEDSHKFGSETASRSHKHSDQRRKRKSMMINNDI